MNMYLCIQVGINNIIINITMLIIISIVIVGINDIIIIIVLFT